MYIIVEKNTVGYYNVCRNSTFVLSLFMFIDRFVLFFVLTFGFMQIFVISLILASITASSHILFMGVF